MTATLAALGASMIQQSSAAMRVATAYVREVALRHAADGGVELGIDRARRLSLADDTLLEATLGTFAVDVRFEAEAGKVDLNVGPTSLLTGLLTDAGATAAEARRLVAQIRKDRTASPRRVFRSVDALMRLEDMRLDVLERLRPNVTVYSGSPGINSALAPVGVLAAIPGITPELANAIRQARRDGSAFPPEARTRLRLYEAGGRPVFKVIATATADDDATFVREAIVDFSNRAQPLTLAWRRAFALVPID